MSKTLQVQRQYPPRSSSPTPSDASISSNASQLSEESIDLVRANMPMPFYQRVIIPTALSLTQALSAVGSATLIFNAIAAERDFANLSSHTPQHTPSYQSAYGILQDIRGLTASGLLIVGAINYMTHALTRR